MEISRYLKVTLLDKDGTWQGLLGDFDYLTVTERWLAQGTGELSVSATHPKLPLMLAPGARYIVELVGGPDQVQVSRGSFRDPVGDFTPGGSVRFQLQDDWRVLNNILIRVNTDEGLQATSLTDPAQSVEAPIPPAAGTDTGRLGYYNTGGGPWIAEDAVRALIEQHLGQRWFAEFGVYRFAVPPSEGRGPDVTDFMQQFRFCTIAEAITPILEYANLGLQFNAFASPGDGPAQETAVMWEPKTWPVTLTPDSGTVVGGEWSLSSPTATDAIVGGPGELASRAFLGSTDTDLRNEYSDLIEVFRNATGAPLEWPTSLAEQFRVAKYYHLLTIADGVTMDQQAAFARFLDTAAADVLAAGAPTSGVSLQLQESEGFRFGGIPMTVGVVGTRYGFATGDYVTVAPSSQTNLSSLEFTARITETTLTQSAKGLTVTPQVGKRIGDPDRDMAETVRAIADSNRRQAVAQ